MNNLQNVKATADVKKAIEQTAQSYARFLQLRTDIIEVGEGYIVVRIEQTAKTTDKVYEAKELVEKAKEVFSHLGDTYQIRVRPLVFAGNGLDAVSAEWVKNQLKKHNMSQDELCQALGGIDKTAMSKLLNNRSGFTNWHRSAFFYYFKSRSTVGTAAPTKDDSAV